MIHHCISPACRTEFRLFHTGFLYAHERPAHDTEFFWLCGPCAAHLVPFLDEEGNVGVRSRSRANSFAPPRPGGDLRVISGPPQRIPWRRNIPAGEPAPVLSSGFAEGLRPCTAT